MEYFIELQMIKHKMIKDNVCEDSGDILSLTQKIHHYCSARGIGDGFLQEYCRYDPMSHFFLMAELGVPISVLLLDIQEIANDFVRRISELCEIFYGEPLTSIEVELEKLKYILLVATDQVHKALKLQTNHIFCGFYRLESPEGTFVFDFFPRRLSLRLKRMGCFGEGAHNLDNIRKGKNQELIYSLFQGFKKGLFCGFPSMVAQSLKKHHKALSNEAPRPKEFILDRLDDLLVEVSKEFQCYKNVDHLVDNFSLGSKSTVESNLAHFGELGYADSRLSGDSNETVLGYFRDPPDLLHSFENDSVPLVVEGYLPKKDEFLEIYPDIIYQSKVQPSCILEPLKVRIITKPQVGIFTRLRKFQKQLWSWLSNHHTNFFQLTGRPLDREALWPICLDWNPGEFFVSGDYSAATDNLKKIISERIIRFLFSDVFCNSPIDYQNIQNSMCSNIIEVLDSAFPQDPLLYKKFVNVSDYRQKWFDFESYKQENGQLMGNILSFPILCLANYLAFHISVERSLQKKLKLWSVPQVKINGDDILFKSNPHHYMCWKDTVSEFGLSPSLGKNFATDKFVVINSEQYSVQTALVGGVYKVVDLVRVPFVNFGLLTFRGKQDCSKDLSVLSTQIDLSIGKVFEKCQDQLAGRASCVAESVNELLYYASSKNFRLKERVMKIFNRHFSFLQQMFPGISILQPGSSVMNKSLFKSDGLSIPSNILDIVIRDFPSLAMSRAELRYRKPPPSFLSNLSKYKRYSLYSKKITSRALNKVLRFRKWKLDIGLSVPEEFESLPDGLRELEYVNI
jgi:hypothetical protein